MDGTALTACQLTRKREHSSALGMRHGWSSTYKLSVEEGRGAFISWACSVDGTALTRCQLRREREHSSALGMQHGWSSTYSLSVEEEKRAFISPGHAAWIGQHLHPVS